jgi:Zinc carboxypeptidase
MTSLHTRSLVLILAVLLLAGLSIALYQAFKSDPEPIVEEVIIDEPEPIAAPQDPRIATIGSSVEGRSIETYTFGTGETTLLFVGGVHGGYEWNSVLLAYEIIDHLSTDPSLVSNDLTIIIIPSLNPDGVFRVIGKEGRFLATDVPTGTDTSVGRFNANGVDLNRNFNCKWQSKSTWRGKEVSAGTGAFSEPEAATLRDLVAQINPVAVVFWHSKANAVYASECEEGILPGTRTLMNTYANAAGYPSVDTFDAYPVTGDAEGWLASIGIPAITVELASHESIELQKNLSGFTALTLHYSTAK